MPQLDVSDVLDDPDFIDAFQVTSSLVAVSQLGDDVSTLSPPVTCLGVVQPANSNDLLRLPELERQQGTIVVYTRSTLTSGSSAAHPDTVTFQCRDYVVKSVDDWSRWGSGYVKATCVQKDLT